MEPRFSSVLVRFGEIALKSNQTRLRMTKMLVDNINAALTKRGIPFDRIRRDFGRIFVETDSVDDAVEVIATVFGVVSCSPVVETNSDFDNIINIGLAIAKGEFQRDLSFAVGARRYGKQDYSSQDIREQLGAAILEELSTHNLSVNLDGPDQSIYVEVRKEKAYIFTKTVDGFGGMPTGTQGKVVCTISTGLDSPVAAFKVMKRGCIPILVYFDNTPHAEGGCEERALKQAQKLAEYIPNHEVKFYIVPHGPDLNDIVENIPEKMTCVFCKRNMLKLAREIALIEGADAIVTGEIIGEQASQTTQNLRAIGNAVCDIPVLRPLAGDDKVDIEHLASKIGTYQFASDAPTCCSLPPKYPIIRADYKEVIDLDSKLDISIISEEVKNSKIYILD